MSEVQVVRRVSVRGSFQLKSPAHFGGDATDAAADMTVARDAKGAYFIPGASIAGACRAFLRYYTGGTEAVPYLKGDEISTEQPPEPLVTHILFGATEKRQLGRNHQSDVDDISQSALIVYDAYFDQVDKLAVRDGVRIASETGQAEATGKYDFEVIPPGATCTLRFDLIIREWHTGIEPELEAALNTLLVAFGDGAIRLGAKTRRGLGHGVVADWQSRDTDFRLGNNKQALVRWLKDDGWADHEPSAGLKSKAAFFRLDATFALQGSVLVRSYPGDVHQPDMVQVKTKNESGQDAPVIPATSATGIIRHRAERILNTLSPTQDAKKTLERIFGDVHETEKRQRASRLRVEEEIINGGETEAQTRIRIDRLTGGVMPGALFEEQPVWTVSGKETTWRLRCDLWEAARVGDRLAAACPQRFVARRPNGWWRRGYRARCPAWRKRHSSPVKTSDGTTTNVDDHPIKRWTFGVRIVPKPCSSP